MALRTRLAALNPERIVMLRGVVRPGILVEEAEAALSPYPSDVFLLRWTGLDVDDSSEPNLFALHCEIVYQTCGCQSFGGLDRGRALAQMDAELFSILQPFQTAKLCYTATPPAPLGSRVFWDEPTFMPAEAQRDRLSRSARLVVYSYRDEVSQ